MKNLKLLFYREIKGSFNLKGSYILSLAFFSISIILLPIGVGPNKGFISSIAPGLVWVSIILTSLLSLNNIFYEDFNDGTLDLFKIGPLSNRCLSRSASGIFPFVRPCHSFKEI